MMEKRGPFDIQFIDLNGVEESERNWILSSLHTSNPNVRLPWVKQPQNVCSYEAKEVIIPPMVNGTAVPLSSYGPPGGFHLHGGCQPPVLFMHRPPTAPFKVNNNVNTITEVPLKNGYCNSYQDTNGIANDNHAKEVNNNINGIKQDIIVEKKEEIVTPSLQTTKSWASVLKPKELDTKTVTITESRPTKSEVVVEKPPVPEIVLKEPFQSNRDDPNLHRMGEFLTSHTIDSRITSLQPRGLINRSNYCYINSILQAVMACPPVYNLFSGLAETLMSSTQTKKVTPIIDGMIRLVKEFQHLPSGLRVGRRLNKTQKNNQHQVAINCDAPIEAHWMNTIFNGVRSDTFIVEGRQEDAEEFFGCLLNGLNDEMLELLKLVGGQNTTSHTISNQEEDKEWQVMGPKNKGSITRRTELNRTPIIDIFGGLLRSRVQRAGDQTTDNIQPFFTLQLNVEKSQNIRDALEHLVNKNQLEGVTSLKTNEEIEAWQQVTIDKLPLVLVFHVKCFDYQGDGCSKITKALEFPIDLKIEPKVLSAAYNAKERQYKLFAVVYHEGKEATKGHYVTDAYHVGYVSWLHYDDASVKPIPEERVLKPGGTRVPYLLFYRRNDTIANNNNSNKK